MHLFWFHGVVLIKCIQILYQKTKFHALSSGHLFLFMIFTLNSAKLIFRSSLKIYSKRELEKIGSSLSAAFEMKLGLILDLNKLHSKRHHNSCTLHRYTHVTALFSMKIRYLAVLLSIILWITVWPLLKTRYFSFIFTKLLKRIFSATGTNVTTIWKTAQFLFFVIGWRAHSSFNAFRFLGLIEWFRCAQGIFRWILVHCVWLLLRPHSILFTSNDAQSQ